MNKTLLNDSFEVTENQTVAAENETATELTVLMKEMKGVWYEASTDLLQPREVMLDQLLKKVLH